MLTTKRYFRWTCSSLLVHSYTTPTSSFDGHWNLQEFRKCLTKIKILGPDLEPSFLEYFCKITSDTHRLLILFSKATERIGNPFHNSVRLIFNQQLDPKPRRTRKSFKSIFPWCSWVVIRREFVRKSSHEDFFVYFLLMRMFSQSLPIIYSVYHVPSVTLTLALIIRNFN